MKKYFTALAVSLLSTIPSLAADTLHITFAGDLLLDRGVRQFITYRGIDAIFRPRVDSVFRQSDLVVANLECPVTAVHAPVFKRFIFRGEPEWLATLHRHGITHLCMANNHSCDQGREGLVDTRRNIIHAGMTPFGAGINNQEAIQPLLLASSPRKVWLIASVMMPLENFLTIPEKPSVSRQSIDSISATIRRLKTADPSCYVIFMPHWGWEHHLEPVPQQIRDAHHIINSGADIIIGHHSHTLQTIEDYHGHRIYYGIGNFIFDQRRPINDKACLVRLSLTHNQAKTETITIHSYVYAK